MEYLTIKSYIATAAIKLLSHTWLKPTDFYAKQWSYATYTIPIFWRTTNYNKNMCSLVIVPILHKAFWMYIRHEVSRQEYSTAVIMMTKKLCPQSRQTCQIYRKWQGGLNLERNNHLSVCMQRMWNVHQMSGCTAQWQTASTRCQCICRWAQSLLAACLGTVFMVRCDRELFSHISSLGFRFLLCVTFFCHCWYVLHSEFNSSERPY